jgi:hypothetical protein
MDTINEAEYDLIYLNIGHLYKDELLSLKLDGIYKDDSILIINTSEQKLASAIVFAKANNFKHCTSLFTYIIIDKNGIPRKFMPSYTRSNCSKFIHLFHRGSGLKFMKKNKHISNTDGGAINARQRS